MNDGLDCVAKPSSASPIFLAYLYLSTNYGYISKVDFLEVVKLRQQRERFNVLLEVVIKTHV